MKILVDADGVLVNFLDAYLEAYNRLNRSGYDADPKVRREDVTDFKFSNCLGSHEENSNVWRYIDRTPGFVLGLGWHPGAEDGLAKLFQIGHVLCVTSPHHGPTWMPERHRWLRERGFDRRDIIFASDKSHVRGDVLIDDKPENCEEWAAENPLGTAILLDALYNRRPLAGRVLRAAHWVAVVDHVRLVKMALNARKSIEEVA